MQVTDNGSPVARSATSTVVINWTNLNERPIISFPVVDGTYNLGNVPAIVSPIATDTYDEGGNVDYSRAVLRASIISRWEKKVGLRIYVKGDRPTKIRVRRNEAFILE